jgi:hypothetical protein|nr:MAG TPA: hypothetical protein [Crassvirales sp.]
MTDKKFKEAEKINKNIEQIKDELSLLKKSEYCCIKLYSDTGSHAKINELSSMPASVLYVFASEYLTKELANLEEQFKNL